MISKKLIRTIEDYLYLYQYIDEEILELKEEKNLSNSRDANSYIRAKGRVNKGVENQALQNVKIDEVIEKHLKWKALITNVVKEYKDNEPEKHYYIKLKYFKKASTVKIQNEMAICRATQSKIKLDIIYYLAFLAINEKLIKL